MGQCNFNQTNINIKIGDDFSGIIQLRLKAAGVINPAPITGYTKIEIHFPAFDATSPVILSTVNSGEITVVDANLSTLSFSGSAAKSLLLNAGNSQKLDTIVTDSTGKQKTYTTAEIVFIENRANA